MLTLLSAPVGGVVDSLRDVGRRSGAAGETIHPLRTVLNCVEAKEAPGWTTGSSSQRRVVATTGLSPCSCARTSALYCTAYSILGSSWDANDAVQDTFLEAYARIDTLRDAGSFRPWLGRILANGC